MLKVRTRCPRTCWIHSNIESEVGFNKVIGLVVIPHSISIRDLLNSWPINYDPWSYMVSIGLGYPDINIVSTKLTIYTTLLSLYFIISNHPVTVSIIVTAFIKKKILSLYYYDVGTNYIYTEFVPWYCLSFLSWQFTFLFIWSFCTLLSVKMSYFLSDGFSYACPVQMLANHCLHSIH